jgi:hypothetical protein
MVGENTNHVANVIRLSVGVGVGYAGGQPAIRATGFIIYILHLIDLAA